MNKALFIIIFAVCIMPFLYPVHHSMAELSQGQTLVNGWKLFNEGNFSGAEIQFKQIEKSSDKKIQMDARLGLGFTYIKLEQFDNAKKLFTGLVSENYMLPKTLPALLQTLPEYSETRYAIAKKILKIMPSDSFALTVSAWHQYHTQDYESAMHYFSKLIDQYPDDLDARIGMGYTLMQLKQYKKALELTDIYAPEQTEKSTELKQLVLSRMIEDELTLDNFDQAIRLFEQMVSTKSYLSVPVITAQQILDTLTASGKYRRAWAFINYLKQNDQTQWQEVAAQFYFNQKSPITADQTFNDPDTCYYNANSIRIEGFAYHQQRSGTSGTSQLDQTVIPISGIVPFRTGQKWHISWVPRHLSSGTPQDFQSGSYYLNINGDRPLSFLNNTVDTSQIFIAWEKEGPMPLWVQIGTSPINTDVSITPVFQLDMENSGWRFNLHRESVEESILSFTGLNDPYGKPAWGRVLKNGVLIGHTKSLLSEGWWISGDIGADLFRGENTIDNYSWQLDIAMGHTRLWKHIWEVTIGGFAGYKHFDVNSNFFTYGHGGYYSPEQYISAGPLFRIKTVPCKDFWIDTQISLGWVVEKNKDNARYPLNNSGTSGLSAPAMSELTGVYSGTSNSGPSASMSIEGWKRLTPSITVGSIASINLSPEYNEWLIGLGLKFSLKPVTRFWDTRPFFKINRFR